MPCNRLRANGKNDKISRKTIYNNKKKKLQKQNKNQNQTQNFLKIKIKETA